MRPFLERPFSECNTSLAVFQFFTWPLHQCHGSGSTRIRHFGRIRIQNLSRIQNFGRIRIQNLSGIRNFGRIRNFDWIRRRNFDRILNRNFCRMQIQNFGQIRIRTDVQSECWTKEKSIQK
jgi:hypothetical protein